MSKKNGAGKRKTVLFSQAEISNLLETVPSNLRAYIDSLQNQISNMSAIGLALSKEKDMEKLLEMILLEAKRISNADGGTLYMMTDHQRLKFSAHKREPLQSSRAVACHRLIDEGIVLVFVQENTVLPYLIIARILQVLLFCLSFYVAKGFQ